MSKLYVASKIRIGVLMGGKSIEREVSFNSGRTICDHLDSEKYEIIPIFQKDTGEIYFLPWKFLHRGKISDFYHRLDKETSQISWDELKDHVDFIYIALHGRFAEDGTIQGLLEVLKIPYLGSKVLGSSLGMNKKIQKSILKSNGIDVPNGITLSPKEISPLDNKKVLNLINSKKINFPLIVKPNHEGSSLGISVVKDPKKLIKAINTAANCDPSKTQEVIIEEKLEGMEFVSVCLKTNNSDKKDNWFALSVTEVVKEQNSDFFDYVQKYMPGRAIKITPARCSKKDFQEIIDTCLKVTLLLNISTISRIDGFLTKDGRIVIIDPNTLTGMGPATFLFNQAAEAKMSHTQLINYLVETSLKEYGILSTTKNVQDSKMKVNIKNKIKVGVLLGGNTNEREISLESGRNICYKLSPHKYEVMPIFINNDLKLFKINQKQLVQNSTKEISEMLTSDQEIKWNNLKTLCDFIFIGLHGGIGENGSVQGALEMLDIPYNGSSVLTSALCMNKFKTANFLRDNGFDVPTSLLISKEEWEDNKNKQELIFKDTEKFTFPLILKPHDDGCSMFVKKIKNKKDLEKEINNFFKESSKEFVLLEEFINAMELTGGVFGNQNVTVMPPSKVLIINDILSLEEKFLPGAGENLTPAPLSEKALDLIKKTLKDAYITLQCKGYVRIDFFYQEAKNSPNKKDRVVILEVNTLPGMTPATCIFHQAAEIGLKPMEFIDKIVELGFENHKKNIVLPKLKSEDTVSV